MDAIFMDIEQSQSLEDRRNDALHTPFTFMIDADGPQLASKWISRHTRAKKLKDKDLLKEFECYARMANVLARYVWRISVALRDPSVLAWPKQPDLPKLG